MNDYLRRPIYLDYNATTPLSSDVADAMRPFLSGVFGNPSSEHPFGAEAKRALDSARRQIANFLSASPEEI
ncbi:MAG: aminotransferase class V-fold PLP-dependent enzyme, partial [Rhodothermales bacterium]